MTSKLNFKTAGASVTELDLLARTLIKLGHQVKFVTTFSNANLITHSLPYSLIEENIPSARQLNIQFGIFKILKKYARETDVFFIDGHNFLYGAGFYRRMGGKTPVAAFFNRELVSWPANVSSLFGQPKDNLFIRGKKKIRWYLEKYLGMPWANAIDIFAFTNPFLREAYKNFGLKKKKSGDFIMGDPFDFRAFMKEHGITEKSYGQRNKTDGKIVLFYSSRMAPGKGFDLLIQSFAKVKNKDNFRLILGGTGPEEQNVYQMVHDLELEPYVELSGWVSREKLYASFKMADIFIQPRWRMDLTSYSLLEAMAFGIPSILPGGGGLEWDAKNSALYFKDGDIQDLAKKIEQLGQDCELRAKLSRNAFIRLSEDDLNYEKKANELNNALQTLMKGH